MICQNLVWNRITLFPIWRKTKGILMSSFELGLRFKEKNALYAAMFLDSGYGTILDQKTK
jgi:hypothetical protein